MRRRDVTTLAAVVAVTSLLTSLAAEARELAGAVQYEMAEELAAGTPVGRGMIVDAHLADIYTSSELSQLTFSLVRGLPPDIASHYFTVDQHTGLLRVHAHTTHSLTVRLVSCLLTVLAASRTILRHLDLSSPDRSKRSPFRPVHFVYLVFPS